jgi:hypothetical protein
MKSVTVSSPGYETTESASASTTRPTTPSPHSPPYRGAGSCARHRQDCVREALGGIRLTERTGTGGDPGAVGWVGEQRLQGVA